MKTELPIPILLADYQQPNFLIDDVFLDIKLGETSTEVVAKLQIYRNPNAAHPHAALVLNGEQLKTQWIALDGHKLDRKKYTVTKNELVISEPPENFVLETSVIIKPQKNTQLEGIYKSNGIFCSQCEAEGFRRITWYLDRPDILARYRTQITGSKKSTQYFSQMEIVPTPRLSGMGRTQHYGKIHTQNHRIFSHWLQGILAACKTSL